MANFNTFLPILLQFEGGWVNDPDDPGGATNKGITFRTFKAYSQRLLGVDPTIENLRNLTDQQAGEIYKKIYWDRVDGDHIDSQDLANIFCDFYVNAGGNAVKVMQRILINNFSEKISVDGAMGPNTFAALQDAANKDLPRLYNTYKAKRIEFYEKLAQRKPKLQKFLQGWLNRVNHFPDMPAG